jgi:hypothetical protein
LRSLCSAGVGANHPPDGVVVAALCRALDGPTTSGAWTAVARDLRPASSHTRSTARWRGAFLSVTRHHAKPGAALEAADAPLEGVDLVLGGLAGTGERRVLTRPAEDDSRGNVDQTCANHGSSSSDAERTCRRAGYSVRQRYPTWHSALRSLRVWSGVLLVSRTFIRCLFQEHWTSWLATNRNVSESGHRGFVRQHVMTCAPPAPRGTRPRIRVSRCERGRTPRSTMPPLAASPLRNPACRRSGCDSRTNAGCSRRRRLQSSALERAGNVACRTRADRMPPDLRR